MALLLAFGSIAHAGETVTFTNWILPESTTNLDSVSGSVKISAAATPVRVACSYVYPNGERGEVECTEHDSQKGVYNFTIPSKENGGVGDILLYVRFRPSLDTKTYVSSHSKSVPMAYEEDLEITANPPEVLHFDLVSPAYQVRYNPCCNILGASVIAKRLPALPTPSDAGLPETLLSDFIHLEPDDLSASTAGLYFTYTFDPEKVTSAGQKIPGLFEYDMRKDEWFKSPNSIVMEGNKIDFHCPAGGYFVLGTDK